MEEKPIWEHFIELTQRLKVILKVLFIAFAVFLLVPIKINPGANFLTNPLTSVTTITGWLLQQILQIVKPTDLKLIAYTISDSLVIYTMAAFLFAVLATMPIIAYEIYKYIDPALYPHERKAIYPFIFSFAALFWVGVLFGLFYLTPLIFTTMVPFFSVVDAEPIITVREFFQVVIVTTFATGVVFTFPSIFVLLVRFGVVSTKSISNNRLYFYSAVFIVTALVTPDGGPVADLILFVPAAILVEISLLIGKYYERKGVVKPRRQGKICKFCQNSLTSGEIFCPKCGRAQE